MNAPLASLLHLAATLLCCASSSLFAQAIAPAEEHGAGRDGGEPLWFPMEAPREVPRPRQLSQRADESADDASEQRFGDPFFLGFAAGSHYPPVDERLDPELARLVAQLGSDDRPRAEIFAYVIFARPMSAALLEELSGLGVRWLGFHPHYAQRAALRPDSLQALAHHPAVRWVGTPRRWQKLHPALAPALAEVAPVGGRAPVWIAVAEDDRHGGSRVERVGSAVEGGPGELRERRDGAVQAELWHAHGWQQQALEKLGVEVGIFLPEMRAFAASINAGHVERLTALDFVLFVEPAFPFRSSHGESMPMVLADYGRSLYPGSTNGAAIGAQIDSGVDMAHEALDHAFYVGWDYVGANNPTYDDCGHGTHVAGTMLASPPLARAGFRGAAHDLGFAATARWRFVKGLVTAGNDCAALGAAFSVFFGVLHNDYVDAQNRTSPRPHVINNSYGADPCNGNFPCSSPWVGTELPCGYLDNEVYTYDQMYVFAAGNDGGFGSSTIGLPGVAKNVFTVGSVNDFVAGTADPSALSAFSSQGPCGDGRWKPNVVAPGSLIESVEAHTNGYTAKQGTSMASPHVAGVALQLVDHYSWLRYQPERVASLLMATATTRNNALLVNETDTHLDTYGTGRVNVHRAHFTNSDWDWENWAFETTGSGWNGQSFQVPAGTTRLVICLHYLEPAAALGASRSLVNDLDLYLDAPPIDPGRGDVGEYTAQQSDRDNTEIRSIDNPTPGTWMWKAWPRSFAPFQNAKASVTVLLYTSSLTPTLALDLQTSDLFVRSNEVATVSCTTSASDGIASAVYLDAGLSGLATLSAKRSFLLDGAIAELPVSTGPDLGIGDVRETLPRRTEWDVSWRNEGLQTISVQARSESSASVQANLVFTVDGTPPPAPGGFTSTSHTPGVWSNARQIDFAWGQPLDLPAGVAGYAEQQRTSPISTINTTLAFPFALTRLITLVADTSGTYYAIRPVDRCDNWGPTVSAGPFLVDTVAPQAPTNLVSTSHTIGQWSNDPTIDFRWNAASDDRSGLAGYSEGVAHAPLVATSNTIDRPASPSSATRSFGSSAQGWYYALRSRDQANNASASTAEIGPFFIDAFAPTAPSNPSSSSHTINTWSSNANLSVSWSAATDLHSGVAGYRSLWDHNASSSPSGALTLGAAATSTSATLGSSAQGWYFHLQAQDLAGNSSATLHFGPFLIDASGPAGPGNLSSTLHAPLVWIAEDRVEVRWSGSTDTGSGLAGYASLFDQTPLTALSGALDLGAAATSRTERLASSSAPWFFHIRARDLAGNWGTTQHYGPILVDTEAPGLSGFTVDSGAASTSSDAVTLHFNASDRHSGVIEQRFQNDGGAFSPWEPLASPRSWNLRDFGGNGALGTRRVICEIRDRAGLTASRVASIYRYQPARAFGRACRGASGSPELALQGIPGAGQTITFTVANSTAALQILELGLSNRTWLGIPLPLDLAFAGSPGCELSVSPDLELSRGPLAPVVLALPPDPLLSGAFLYFQALLLGDPSGAPLLTTNGLELRFAGL